MDKTFKLALTDSERRDLMRLMHRVLREIEVDRSAYIVRAKGDPMRGRLVKDGEDITEQTNLDKIAADRFLDLARLP